MQRMVAFACLVAGVLVLWGVGWALLAAGCVLWVRDDRATAWLAARRDRALELAARYRTMPRRVVASSAMGVGLVVTPVGVAVAAGVGLGLAAAGVLLVGFSLLTGEGA